MRRLIFCALGAACSASVFAQATAQSIVDGDVVYTVNANAYTGANTAAGGSANFRVAGAAGTDHFFRDMWAYRLDGHTREFMVRDAGATVNFAGNTGTVDVSQAADSLGFRLTFKVIDTDGAAQGQGRLVTTLRVVNVGSTTRTVNLFNYVDCDVNGSGAGDVGSVTTNGNARNYSVTDVNTLNAVAYGTSHWYNNILIVGNFTDTDIDDFNDSAANVGPVDLAIGAQWTFELAPDSFREITMGYAINTNPVPEPATMAALALGSVAMLRRRRK